MHRLLIIAALLGAVVASLAQQNPAKPMSRGESWAVFGYDPRADFRAFDPQYFDKINRYKDEIEQIKGDLYKQGLMGRARPCARNIMLEAHWLTHYTAHYDQIEERMQALRALLKKPSDSGGRQQSPEDGSFDTCSKTWFMKVDNSVNELMLLEYSGATPKYPLRFLDRINSPEKLRAYLDSVILSDVRASGEDKRYESNISISNLLRLINGRIETGYKFHRQLERAMIDFLDNVWQDPKTGFWGEWYKTKDGSIRKTADLSATFHIASYREGQVKRWPEMVRTVLTMKDLEYPYGWRQEGKPSNHHNYDVVRLLHLGWRSMTHDQRVQAKAAIRQMIDFCLKETLNPDGSFKMMDEDSVGSSFYFPVALLYEAGYFSRANRFWTDETFPEAKALAGRIAKKIKSLGLTDIEAQNALLMVATAE